MHADHRPAFSLESLPKYLTEDEVAAWLKTPIKTVVRMRYDRKGPPFVRLGLSYRYPMVGLLEWLARKTT
ncbi:helix-turn-helix domain-containing protein [uncultured Brevundimonas sp.]|uniref:helix-turn-helix domain-containing protein n=1 Tax=uncultured Brevundimonas sp. TaxID=213418 RepID=UPI0025DF5582|nr:helix-turn-helix domain-containing protein [uncultured Brevundimonas sp.]